MTQTHPDKTHTDVDVGPIDYLAVEFPNAEFTGEALGALVDLVDRGIIRVLDMRVAIVTEHGFTAMALSDVDGDGELDLTVFQGVESGLLEDDDLAQSAALVGPGNAVALLVYENTWAAPFATALRKNGAQLVAGGRIPVNAMIAALDELEGASA